MHVSFHSGETCCKVRYPVILLYFTSRDFLRRLSPKCPFGILCREGCTTLTRCLCVCVELDAGPLRSLTAARGRKEHMSEEEERLFKDNQSLALQVRTRNQSPECSTNLVLHHTHTHTYNHFTTLLDFDFVRDYPGELAPER